MEIAVNFMCFCFITERLLSRPDHGVGGGLASWFGAMQSFPIQGLAAASRRGAIPVEHRAKARLKQNTSYSIRRTHRCIHKTSKHQNIPLYQALPSLFFFLYIVMDHTTESLRTPWLAWCARCCRLVDFRHECDPKVLPFGLGTLQTTSPTGLANHPAYSAVEAFQDLWLNQLNHKQPQATTSRLIWAAEQKCVS